MLVVAIGKEIYQAKETEEEVIRNDSTAWSYV